MDALYEKIGYRFKNPEYLSVALTHSSYANEARQKSVRYNERLEFLGDSVLNMLTAEYLYANYPALREGELTRFRAVLVCEDSLHRLALKIGLSAHLLLGRGEDHTGGRSRPSILADAAEALIAAIYLDGGLEAAREFLAPHLDWLAADAEKLHFFRDYKTALQEIVQKSKQETIRYELSGESGPDHEKLFTVTLFLNSNPIAQGSGKSKKDAEQSAAMAALKLMGEEL